MGHLRGNAFGGTLLRLNAFGASALILDQRLRRTRAPSVERNTCGKSAEGALAAGVSIRRTHGRIEFNFQAWEFAQRRSVKPSVRRRPLRLQAVDQTEGSDLSGVGSPTALDILAGSGAATAAAEATQPNSRESPGNSVATEILNSEYDEDESSSEEQEEESVQGTPTRVLCEWYAC